VRQAAGGHKIRAGRSIAHSLIITQYESSLQYIFMRIHKVFRAYPPQLTHEGQRQNP